MKTKILQRIQTEIIEKKIKKQRIQTEITQIKMKEENSNTGNTDRDNTD